MIETITLTLSDPDVLASIDLGDHALLTYVAEASHIVTSIWTESEWVLVNLYIRRNSDPPSHVLIRSWKDWGFESGLWFRPGYVVELEVAWMGDDPPSNPRVAVIELET